jgi:ribosomal protein S4
MNAVFTQARRHALSLMQVVPTLHALQSGMLRRALRKRRDERPFTDLRKSAQQRRLPKDQRPLPWKAKRAVRRRSKAKFGPWNYRTLDNSPAAFSAWTLQRLAFTATQTDELTPVTTDNSISGETLTLCGTRIEREKRIRRGFAIVPKIRPKGLKRRKNRRRTKRFRGRARKLVTSALGDFRRYRHWSERRSQGSGTNYGTISRQLVISKRFSPAYKTLKRLPQRTTTLKRYRTALQDLRQQQSNKFTLIRATRLATRLSATYLLSKKRPNRLKYHRASCNRLLVGPSRLTSVDTGKQYVGKRLVNEVSLLSSISPLLFEKVTARSIKTEAAKEKAIAANIASKEARYKFTAQYLESITTFIPALMNQILTKNILDKQITATYKAAQHLIRNIYWSLRVYLNVDPFDTRFTLRDSKPAARAALIEVLDKMAKSQTTEQPQRAALRYSFQSGRLHRAPSTWRFREDWLRVFFPSQHALFQESPEDYGLFLLSTKNIRRLRIGNKGIASWRTARTTTSLETRSRQLLTLRTGKTPRFETALQHSRRTVLPESVPLATGAALGRTSFFTRGFSTQARRTTFVVSRQLQQFRRLVPTEGVELEGEQTALAIEKEKELPTATTFNIAVSRSRVMPRIEARGRTNYAVEGRSVMAGGSLDLRFVRRKSPRSRQYLLRTPVQVATASKQKQAGALILSRQTCLLRQSSRPAVGWTRASRRSVSAFFIAPTRPEVTWLSPAVRRTLTALKWRTEFTARRRAITQAATRRLKHISQRAQRAKRFEQSTPAQIAALRRTTLQANQDSTEGRAVLQSRTAGSRLVKVVPTAPVTLRNAPIRQSWRFAKYLQARHQALVVDVKGPSQLKPKNKLHREPAEPGEYTPLTRREQNTRTLTALTLLRKNKKLLAATKQHYPRGRRRFRQRVSTATVSALQKSWLRGFHLPPQKPVHTGWKRRLRFSYQQAPTAVIFMGGRFINQSAHSAVDRAYLSRALPALTKARQETPFEAHRPKLWDGLSLRKMKRERIARRWLKETSRWLRDPWLAEIVSLRKRRGAYAAREQQIGEYVAEVDAEGRDISEEHSPVREREALVRKGKNKPIKGRNLLHKLILKKPIPAMWLAQHEYKDVLKEYAENKKKSWKELVAEKEAEIKEWNLREKSGIAHEKPRRAPLKHPADNWLPHGIWKEIQRRVRKFEWRESDEVFFRKGFQNAFRFFPQEYNRAPWLEALMYTRATYSTRLREFRRRQFPREQKKYKWLQRVRKSLAPTKAARYLKGRRWPQLRTYNQKLHYSLFNLPDRHAASRHFQKLARRSRPAISSFVASQQGLGDRLDVTLLHLNIVPSIFWARVVAPFGLLRVNGKILYNCASRISPGDLIQPEWDRISRFQHFFKSALKQRDALQENPQVLTSAYPKNFEFHRGVRAMFYRHAPEETDIRQSNRLQPHLFRWFRLDSV